MFVFYHVSKTISRILGLQPNVLLYLILSVFLAFNVTSYVCQLCNKEWYDDDDAVVSRLVFSRQMAASASLTYVQARRVFFDTALLKTAWSLRLRTSLTQEC